VCLLSEERWVGLVTNLLFLRNDEEEEVSRLEKKENFFLTKSV